jgi:hypothetical protein
MRVVGGKHNESPRVSLDRRTRQRWRISLWCNFDHKETSIDCCALCQRVSSAIDHFLPYLQKPPNCRFAAREFTVVLADHDRDSDDRLSNIIVRGVNDIKEHEAFDPFSFNNDIAVLELDEPVDFGVDVQTACLPRAGNVDYSGQTAVVAGWGRLGEKEKPSRVLRKVAVPVWSKQDCYNSGYGEKKISENMFCAGYPDGKKDACQVSGPRVLLTA